MYPADLYNSYTNHQCVKHLRGSLYTSTLITEQTKYLDNRHVRLSRYQDVRLVIKVFCSVIEVYLDNGTKHVFGYEVHLDNQIQTFGYRKYGFGISITERSVIKVNCLLITGHRYLETDCISDRLLICIQSFAKRG